MKIIGQELSVIRKHLGLSVGDIQHRTKLSKEIIESIENGLIFDRNSEKDVYLRTYIRSIARALKIDDTVIVKALDQLKAGNYNHLLLDYYPELNQSADGKNHVSPSDNSSESTTSGRALQKNKDSVNVEDGSTGGANSSATVEIGGRRNVEGLETSASTPTVTETRMVSGRTNTLPGDEAGKEINWAQMGKQFNQPQKKFSWKKTIGWMIFILLILASVYIFMTLL